MIDFTKPIRFACDKEPARTIGRRANGHFVVEGEGSEELFIVDENGYVQNWRLETPFIKNIPERITRWILMTPNTGYDNKEDALRAVELYEGYENSAVVMVEFEEGER